MSNTTDRREFFRRVANSPAFDPERLRQQDGTRQADLTDKQIISRFLAQTTLGADINLINYVDNIGIEAWLEEQFNTPQSEILEAIYQIFPVSEIATSSPDRSVFRFALWDALMMGDDLLRQRVALAFSEIFVISTENSDLYSFGNGIGGWYDMLLKHAFGNFRDLLYEVTLSPIMGTFLSHAGNRKTNESQGRFPDENYAREIMQLFTIGLFLLNEDGSLQLDTNGNPIPTYDNSHITEFAKIFTGMTYDHDGDPTINYDADITSSWLNGYTSVQTMKVFDEEHEPGAKTLLNGYVVPAGQTTLEDVNEALDHLFNHQNVGPFIGRLLIQRLVKSNPSPAYISRITAVFNDNGGGERGDLQAVVRAILLDDEARNISYIEDSTAGKLREPFFRYTHLFRAFNYSNPQNKFWDAGWTLQDELRQYMFNAPSVFNFFSPDYRPPGPISAAGLTAPEFQLLNSYTAISLMNVIYAEFEWGTVMNLPDPDYPIHGVAYDVDHPKPDWSTELALTDDLDALIDHLDLLLTYGTLSPGMRGVIKTALIGMTETDRLGEDADRPFEIVKLAVYLFMVSPDYAIQL
ncbi:MAG: DUF1800 family protein [Anaerolineae bacterium]